MTTDPTKLSGLELRAAVAVEVMGWKPTRIARDFLGNPFPEEPPAYESSRDACQAVLEEIERRGLMRRLAFKIMCIIPPPSEERYAVFVAIEGTLKATPEQICRAALAAVREHKETRYAE